MKLVDEKQIKTTQELKRLEDSLCYEKQNTMNEISRRKSAEMKWRELEIRNENANMSSSGGGKKWMEKLELKIRDLEAELEVEKRKGREAVKMERQMERHFKDMEYQYFQEKRNFERVEVSHINELLCQKITVYVDTQKDPSDPKLN